MIAVQYGFVKKSYIKSYWISLWSYLVGVLELINIQVRAMLKVLVYIELSSNLSCMYRDLYLQNEMDEYKYQVNELK